MREGMEVRVRRAAIVALISKDCHKTRVNLTQLLYTLTGLNSSHGSTTTIIIIIIMVQFWNLFAASGLGETVDSGVECRALSLIRRIRYINPQAHRHAA